MTPVPNTAAIAVFRFAGICNRDIEKSGRNNKMMSATKLTAAVATSCLSRPRSKSGVKREAGL